MSARARPPRSTVNPAVASAALPQADAAAGEFHRSLEGYAPTPVHELPAVAAAVGCRRVAVKDESNRLGLPAFKVLGASWAVERALREHGGITTLVAASAGNHGRAVAFVAARRGLASRIYVPARAARARRDAIAAEGAEVVVVDGTYEDAVRRAAEDGTRAGVLEVADVGASGPARWVIDGYATLFGELADQGELDLMLVPTGVGSLAAAAARYGRQAGVKVIGVEPVTAACLTASLLRGRPTPVATPGTTMAGLDCAEVSPAAWPSLAAGLHGTIAVADDEVHAAMRELAARGLAIGDCGAAPLAALRALAAEEACSALRDAVGFGASARVLLLATEGVTDPASYQRAIRSSSAPGPFRLHDPQRFRELG